MKALVYTGEKELQYLDFNDPIKKDKYCFGIKRARGNIISLMNYSHRFVNDLKRNLKSKHKNSIEIESN